MEVEPCKIAFPCISHNIKNAFYCLTFLLTILYCPFVIIIHSSLPSLPPYGLPFPLLSQFVIIQELCDKGTLAKALQKGLFKPVPKAIRPGAKGVRDPKIDFLEVALDIATGLSYIHSQQLIHGDLKPENVMLKSGAQRGHCKVTAKVSRQGGYIGILQDG